MNSDKISSGQPAHQPTEVHRNMYLPEEYYLLDTGIIPVFLATRITLLCVAKWADSYEASALTDPGKRREASLPEANDEKSKIITELIEWLERSTDRPELVVLNLYRSGEFLLNAHEGLPGTLFLTSNEFDEFQNCLEKHGLPRDLYYPAEQQHRIVEPVEKFGGIVRAWRRYTPLQWAHRDAAAIEALRVPSEEERAAAFARTCEQFALAVLLRVLQLKEPGRKEDSQEVGSLLKLHADVLRAAARARGRLPPSAR